MSHTASINTSSTKPATATELVLEVAHATRPSLRAVCTGLGAKAALVKPFPSNVPLALNASLLLNAPKRAWRGDRGLGWHLANPSAANVANAILRVLGDSHLLDPGQVVHSSASKMFHTEELNVLIVTITQIDTNCYLDAKTFKHKMLDWYFEQCSLKNIPPTKETFNALLKNLKQKNKKSKNADVNLDIANLTPDFINEE